MKTCAGGGPAQRRGVGPGGDVDALRQEAVGAQSGFLLGEEGEALGRQVGVQGEVGAGAVGAGDSVGARSRLGAQDAVDVGGVSGGPVGRPEQDGEEPVDEVGVVVQQPLVDGDGAGVPLLTRNR